MSQRPLADLVRTIDTWNPARSDPDETFRYIDLSAVDQDLKSIVGVREVSCAEAPSRARQLVEAGDILVSTVRPNLNGVAMVSSELDGATASTGFCVLRPKRELLDSRYLSHWVKSPIFVREMVRQATGASYPAVSDRIVLASSIPNPPLHEQRRIAAILDQADILRAKRREALARLGSLTQSIFMEMFGDPSCNARGWTTLRLEDVATKVTDGEHQTPRRVNAGIRLLSARNVQDGYLDFNDVDYIDQFEYQRISKRCNPEIGDILISCSGSIGRVASVEVNEPLALVRSAALVKPDTAKIEGKFLETYLRAPSMKRLMEKSARSSSQANLFQGPIRALPVFLPPRELQVELVKRLRTLRGVAELQSESQERLDGLFASLQQRAFSGEL